MPPNYKTGKTRHGRNCPVEDCDMRPRDIRRHMIDHHKVEDPNAWWQDHFEKRYGWRPTQRITRGPWRELEGPPVDAP